MQLELKDLMNQALRDWKRRLLGAVACRRQDEECWSALSNQDFQEDSAFLLMILQTESKFLLRILIKKKTVLYCLMIRACLSEFCSALSYRSKQDRDRKRQHLHQSATCSWLERSFLLRLLLTNWSGSGHLRQILRVRWRWYWYQPHSDMSNIKKSKSLAVSKWMGIWGFAFNKTKCSYLYALLKTSSLFPSLFYLRRFDPNNFMSQIAVLSYKLGMKVRSPNWSL